MRRAPDALHKRRAPTLIIRKTLRWNMQESGNPQGDTTNRLFRPSGIIFAGILGRLPVPVGSLCSLRERTYTMRVEHAVYMLFAE